MSEVLVTRGQFLVCNTRVIVNLLGDDIRVIERNTEVLLNTCKDIGLAVNTGKNKYGSKDISEVRCTVNDITMGISNSYGNVKTLKNWALY